MKRVFEIVILSVVFVTGCHKQEPEQKQAQEQEQEKKDGEVGLQAVDLGLSVKWANMNVGASSFKEFGSYFSWGEVDPKTSFEADNYKFNFVAEVEYSSLGLWEYNVMSRYWNEPFALSEKIVDSNFEPDNLTVLLPEDDAATQTLGKGWRMPTKEEFKELFDNCKFSKTDIFGEPIINLLKCTGPNGNSIYFVTYRTDDMSNKGYIFWTSSLDKTTHAWSAEFTSGVSPSVM